MNAIVLHGGNAPRLPSVQVSDSSNHDSSNILEHSSYWSVATPAANALLAPVSQTVPALIPTPIPTRHSSSQRSEHLRGPLRRGKWTLIEEEYTAATIHYFCAGVLNIAYGTTLRSYLAQQLHCDPMRISKKLLPGTIVAGYKMASKIGRRGYYPRLTRTGGEEVALQQQQHAAERHLESLRDAFLASLDVLRKEEEEYERLETHYRKYYSRCALVSATAVPQDAFVVYAAAAGGRKRQLFKRELVYPPAARMRMQREYMHHPSILEHQQRPSRLQESMSAPYGMRAIEVVDAVSPRALSMLPPLWLSLQRASAIMPATR